MMSSFRRQHARYRSEIGLIVGMIAVAAGVAGPRGGNARLAAQAAGPCTLLMTTEIQPLAPKASIGAGVPTGATSCRYSWGEGADRHKLDVVLSDPSRVFTAGGADAIKQGLRASVKAGSADAVVPDLGEAAVFKAESPVYVHATAYVKGRLVQVLLDGFEAREHKDQVIALLKSAASRL
jgi:hypothetical protein